MNAPAWQDLQGDHLLDEIPHGIMVMNRDYEVVRHNRAFTDVFGESHGKRCYEIYKNRNTPCPECVAMSTFEDGQKRVLEESGLDLHGQIVHYLAQLTPLRDETGEVTHVAAITTDLTTTKRLQREYQTLFEKVPCYVTVLNRDRRVVKANEMFRRTFGEPRGEFCYKLFKHRHAECEDCPAARTFADGESHTSRHVGTSRDGRATHYVVSTAPLLRGDGEITHVIEMCLDVTESAKMEAELVEARALRKALVENSLDAIVVTDAEQKIVLMNKAAEVLWSADREALIGCRIPHQILPKQLKHANGSHDDVVLLPDTNITSLNGETIPVRLSAMNLYQQDHLMGGAVIAHDRRDVKELEREKITAERLAAVGQTVAGLAHGIKNVLMGLDGGMYAFQSGMRNGDNERMLKGWQMLENINRISTFVKEFLEFAKGRKPTVKLVDPNVVAGKVVDLFRDKAAMVGITLEAEMEDGIPYALMDEDGILSCLDNLVSNALDACEICDRENRRVVVRTRETDSALIIEVADNGAGIDYDIRKKVFTTFFSTKGANKGTGLGLLTTRKIVQQHGGKVSFESTAGEGSVFVLEFPRDRLPSLDDENEEA